MQCSHSEKLSVPQRQYFCHIDICQVGLHEGVDFVLMGISPMVSQGAVYLLSRRAVQTDGFSCSSLCYTLKHWTVTEAGCQQWPFSACGDECLTGSHFLAASSCMIWTLAELGQLTGIVGSRAAGANSQSRDKILFLYYSRAWVNNIYHKFTGRWACPPPVPGTAYLVVPPWQRPWWVPRGSELRFSKKISFPDSFLTFLSKTTLSLSHE